MDAVVLCGGKSTRLNAFSCINIDKVKIFEHKLIDQLKEIGIEDIYFLGSWDYQNDEERRRLNAAGIYYKKYPELKSSYQEISALIKDTKIMPPFVLVYGDVLQYGNVLEYFSDSKKIVKKYKTLSLLGYEIIMNISNTLFDYEDGNIAIHNTKPSVIEYGIKNSSWIDAGMFFINQIDTEEDKESWQDYLKMVIKSGKVGYVLVDRPFELNTPYSLYKSQLVQ